MRERDIVMFSAGLLLVIGLIYSLISGSVYLTLAAIVGLFMLPIWYLVLQRIDRYKSTKEGEQS